MESFVVKGVNKNTGEDVSLQILAESEANAKIKAELQGIIVTSVLSDLAPAPSPPVLPIQRQSEVYEDPKLKPGDSIDQGFCYICGKVPVKTTGKGYNPGCGGLTFHLIMLACTLGGWLPFWGGWAIVCYLRKGKRTCMKCGEVLQPDAT